MSSPRAVPPESPRVAPSATGDRVHVAATVSLTAAAVLSTVSAVTAYAAGGDWQLSSAVAVLLAGVLFVDRRVPAGPAERRPRAAAAMPAPSVDAVSQQPVDYDRLLDPLTKLSSRQTLTLMAGPMIEHARRSGLAVHCLYLDIVELARVNDSHGQVVGDDLLVSVAEALTEAVRGTDVVARWGGDEFVVIGPGTGISPLELERRLSSRPGPGGADGAAGAPAGPGIGSGVPGAATALPGDVSVGSSTLVPWDDGGLDSLLRRAEQDMALRRSLRQQAKQRPATFGEAARRARDTPA